MYDVIIIGAGITGAGISLELAKYDLNVLVLEKENDVSLGASKANSGIVHAGYDPSPDTLMAKLNLIGSKMYEDLAKTLNFHYEKIGSLVVGNEEEKAKIDSLYERGVKNGVKNLEVLDSKALHELEPNLSEDLKWALYAQDAAIISPWEATLSFLRTAVFNGVTLKLNSEVTRIEKKDDFYQVYVNDEVYETKAIINAAGLHSDEIYSLIKKDQKEIKIMPVNGEYFLLDKCEGNLVNHVIFQTPSEKGKGVLVSKTVHGNLIVGPNASEALSKDDLTTTSDNLAFVKNASLKTTKKINFRNNIRNFTGLRATNFYGKDFAIFEDQENKNFFNFAAIKSPGLSCGPAFGIYAKELLEKNGFKFLLKKDYKDLPLPGFLKEKSPKEINEIVKKEPLYGRVICRCETVTEGEIVKMIHDIIPARTIDAIKRRTNAGMGRCQGGFCAPKILEILMRELKLSEKEILKDQNGSYVILGGEEDDL